MGSLFCALFALALCVSQTEARQVSESSLVRLSSLSDSTGLESRESVRQLLNFGADMTKRQANGEAIR